MVKDFLYMTGFRIVEEHTGGCADITVYALGNGHELVITNACTEIGADIR